MTITDFILKNDRRLGRRCRIGFFGLGISNTALMDLVPRDGRHIVIRSEGDIPRHYPFDYRVGETATKDISEDLLFLSPSVRRERDCFSYAVKRGTVLSSDCELFFADDGGERFLITGSDGKSTTTTLISELLGEKFDTVHTLGNIGVPYAAAEKHDSHAYVCELSSFNLRYIAPRSRRCVITNISENHLDWHSSFDEYIHSKMNILTNSEGAVLSADCPVSLRIASERYPFAVFSQEHDLPTLKGMLRAEHYITLGDGKILCDGAAVLSLSEIRRREKYNIYNVMAAIGATLGYATAERVAAVSAEFDGLSHRCRLCHSGDGVDFIDSSIDTTPARCATTLSEVSRPVHIILGGRSKGLSLAPLENALAGRVLSIGLYGEAAAEMESFINSSERLHSISHERFDRFADAVKYCSKNARSGEVVLLSPAATGYGEFQSYAHRAMAFLEEARRLRP